MSLRSVGPDKQDVGLLLIIHNNPGITTNALSKKVSLWYEAVRNRIYCLQEKGYIIVNSTKRAGYLYITAFGIMLLTEKGLI
jgi:DNA-binding Lrp family transcriptional regulator